MEPTTTTMGTPLVNQTGTTMAGMVTGVVRTMAAPVMNTTAPVAGNGDGRGEDHGGTGDEHDDGQLGQSL